MNDTDPRPNLRIDKASPLPIRTQIKAQIKDLIHAGVLKQYDQLPTIRALAIDLAVNPNTIAQAYLELDMEGMIVTERGRGTFVAQTPGEEEMLRIRAEKLAQLVAVLFSAAGQLGYTPAEILQAVQAGLPKT